MLNESLFFFKLHKLFGGASRLFEMHQEFINKGKKMVEEAKQYHKLDSQSQSIM